MEKISMPVFYLERKTVRGFKNIDEFIDNVKDHSIYVVDVPSFRGRDFNFKILSRLSALYDLWYEGNTRWVEDVSDIILSGAKMAVLSGKKLNENFIYRVLSLTENVAIKSDDPELLKKFRDLGGKYAITSVRIDGLVVLRMDGGRVEEL